MHGGRATATLLALVAAAVSVSASATDPDEVIMGGQSFVDEVVADPAGAAQQDPNTIIDEILDPQPDEPREPGAPERGKAPGFADRMRAAFDDTFMAVGLAAVIASALGLGGFALVTRYVSPKEALQNPQRAMLYGFVRGNPGVHLKKLSEEFAMKTSSILWHIRKLENAELVRSERANGFRVFYPVEGGIEVKKVSRAITALQNPNARALFEAVDLKAGASPTQLSNKLAIHGGTVRWHLRKLREFGLVEEMASEGGSTFFATQLGRKALQTLLGTPSSPKAPPTSAPAAFNVEA